MEQALGDIKDIQAYVARVVDRKFAALTPAQREDMIGQGVLVSWETWRHVYKRDFGTTFSGFLSGVLGRRLIDYWRTESSRDGTVRQNSRNKQRYIHTPRPTDLEAICGTMDEPSTGETQAAMFEGSVYA